jgi:hypothetical protein
MKPSSRSQHNIAYIPLQLGSKRPSAKGWNLRENIVTQSKDANKLNDMNIGLAHAYCDPVTCCIDVDHLPSANKWFANRDIDLIALLTSSGAIAESGRINSLKAFYTLPMIKTTLAVKVDGQVAFEFRCATKDGKTVCDVIPPSIHPSGTQYEWTRGSLSQLKPLPERLLALWDELLAQTEHCKQHGTDQEIDTPRRVAVLRDLLRYINPDCDYESWRDVVFSILSSEYVTAEEIAREWSESSCKYDPAAFNSLVKSYKHGSFTLGTIYHYARQGGYRD